MPTRLDNGGTPIVEFDPRLEISPFTLFRRLREGKAPLLIDLRGAPIEQTLEGAASLPDPEWEPPADREVVFFDRDGSDAVSFVRALQSRGFERARALFGGLELYRFALDPEVVGQDTFLVQGG